MVSGVGGADGAGDEAGMERRREGSTSGCDHLKTKNKGVIWEVAHLEGGIALCEKLAYMVLRSLPKEGDESAKYLFSRLKCLTILSHQKPNGCKFWRSWLPVTLIFFILQQQFAYTDQFKTQRCPWLFTLFLLWFCPYGVGCPSKTPRQGNVNNQDQGSFPTDSNFSKTVCRYVPLNSKAKPRILRFRWISD